MVRQTEVPAGSESPVCPSGHPAPPSPVSRARKAPRAGRCTRCGQRYPKGALTAWLPGSGPVHEQCAPPPLAGSEADRGDGGR
jgi:hypothetical protein